ncbi:MAG: ankyrin repeat domain-containing protein [Treponema sp.]|nr:ankyrin repeat domain-containing protein [Treponema sp.]
MNCKNRYLLIIAAVTSVFPLYSLTSNPNQKLSDFNMILENENEIEKSEKLFVPVFFSRKKVKDSDKKALERQKKLASEREKAEADILARKAEEERLEQERLAAEEEARLEAERLEAERLEQERIAKEQEEARKKEEERLEAERLEKERLEKEKQRLEQEALQQALEEKQAQEKLEKQIELELENQKNSEQKNRKEYLSDFMIYDFESINENNNDEDNSPIENPNEITKEGKSLLMLAAQQGNENQIKRLLASGADVNLKDKDGWTALMYAVRYCENAECTILLLEDGAKVTETNIYGTTALALAACYNRNEQIIKNLLSYYKSTDKEVLRALVFLLSEQNISEEQTLIALNLFLKKGIPLNVLYEGKTPLMYACQYGNSTKIIKALLDNNASAKIRSTEGKTAFDYAINNKNLAHDETYWALNKK